MKRRIILLAHVGVVLVVISLAFCLGSLIPRGSLYPWPTQTELLEPEQFSYDATPSQYAINPQLGMHIIFTSNKTLSMEVFSLNYTDLEEWLGKRNKNASVLAEFEATYSSDLILRQNISSGTTIFDYFPPRIENATVIVSNPTLHAAKWSYTTKDVEVIAAPESVFLAAVIMTSFGVALIIPCLVFTIREKRKTNKLT